jgi:hypothetical protein
MKRISLFAVIIIAGLFSSLTSCQKNTEDIIVKKTIKKVAFPPDNLQRYNPNNHHLAYGQTREGLVFKEDMSARVNEGYNCLWFYDSWDDRWYSDKCGDWYILPVYKVWGEKDDIIYISTGPEFMVVNYEIMNHIHDEMEGRKYVTPYIQPQTQGRNPFDVPYQVSWVRR